MLNTIRDQHNRIGDLETTVRELDDKLDTFNREKDGLVQAKAAFTQRLSNCKTKVKTLKDEVSGEHDIMAGYFRGETKHFLSVR